MRKFLLSLAAGLIPLLFALAILAIVANVIVKAAQMFALLP